MIQMFHVYKYYGKDHVALDDINLKIEKGEFVFLVGSSGAGKSTLLKLIFCEESAEQGQILISGKNISRLTASQIPFLRRNVGFVFQDFKLIRRKTVFDNIALPLEIVGASGSEVRRRVQEVLKLVQLEHRRNQFPQYLSGGEQQRVAIARAIVNHPPLLLADEPTGNLDDALSVEIMDLLKNIHIHGTTVVVATHRQHPMVKMAKRTILLQKGKIVSDGMLG